MARKFKKNPSMTMVYVPGFGRLMGDTIIEGDQYARFAPAILVEVAEADLPKVPAPPLAAVEVPAPLPLPPPPPPPPAPASTPPEVDSSQAQSQGTLTVEDVWDSPVTPEASVVVDLGAQSVKTPDKGKDGRGGPRKK